MPLKSYKHLGKFATTERLIVIPENPQKISLDIPSGTHLNKIEDMDTQEVFWFNPERMYMIPDCYRLQVITEEDD